MTTPEEIENLRKEGLARIIVGGVDSSGNKVYGVYVKGDEFAIYSTGVKETIKGIRVRIDTIDPDDEVPINNFQAVKGEFDKLKAVSERCIDTSYAARAAHALSVAIYGEPEKARAILSEIYNNIEEEYREHVIGKTVYISGTALVSLIFCSISLYFYLWQPSFILEERTTLYELVLVCTFSTLGGILSVYRNINFIDIDKGLGKAPYLIYGIERSVFSVLGGIFVFFVIKSNLLFGFINNLENSLYGLLVFGFLAGFSETLVPNALNKLEKNANTKN